MARFENCIDFVIKHEGGYTVDHAGPTNYGVTVSTLRRETQDANNDGYMDGDIDHDGDIDADDIRKMAGDDAKEIYRRQWWAALGYDRILSDLVARKVFDMAVNMGHSQGVRLLQRAVNALLPMGNLKVDGIMGAKTVKATNQLDPVVLVKELRAQMAAFYRRIVHKHPSYQKFINGWLRRADA